MARGDGLKNYENLDLKDAKNDNRLTEVYRDWAKKYDYDNDHVLGTVSQPKSVNLLSTRLKDKTAKIIDVGCGTGLVGEKLKAKDFIYFDGLDISKDMLSIAKSRGYRNLFLGSLNKQLPVLDDAYDAAMCIGVFTHGHVSSDRFNELCRIVKPGGYVCFTINEGVFEEYGFKEMIAEFQLNKVWEVISLYKDDYMTLENVKGYYCLAVVQ
jgi:ubiquinone/menaquinone biosynthesis C-methylase UbiE|tara:strand:- start:465 stop:1097 length:633 start_codon:yes stop_codon:yes gene_type:complete